MNHDGPCASRLPPAKVEPITIGNIRYAQLFGKSSVDGQMGALLAAYDDKGGMLWTIKVYDSRRKPELEGDVQDVFFSSMSLDSDGRLRIVNERGDTFLVDVKAHIVTAIARSKFDDDEDVFVSPSRS
jgi:hypothetical protein